MFGRRKQPEVLGRTQLELQNTHTHTTVTLLRSSGRLHRDQRFVRLVLPRVIVL